MAAHPVRRPSGYVQPPGWKRTVARIIARDRGVCYLCGRPGADTADHVVPVSQGGSHHDSNLKAAHREPCHKAKTERERLAALRKRTRRRPVRRNPNLL
jgi:5-methylcytosine-specific restriction protein A